MDYAYHEQLKGAGNGNKGNIRAKLICLYSVCEAAEARGVYGVDLKAFKTVKPQLKSYRYLSKAVSHATMMQFDTMDKSRLSKCQRLHIDLFLFSYFAGGMCGIDICYLAHSWIKNNTIEYERIKYDNRVRVILTDKAIELIEKIQSVFLYGLCFPDLQTP